MKEQIDYHQKENLIKIPYNLLFKPKNKTKGKIKGFNKFIIIGLKLLKLLLIIRFIIILNNLLPQKKYDDDDYIKQLNLEDVDDKKREKKSDNIEDILPRISLKNVTIPSLDEIFNSREIYIPESYLTGKYIKYIRPINETEELVYQKELPKEKNIISPEIFKKRPDQFNYVDFGKLCLEEKLIDSKKIEYNNKPDISIVIPSYNKEDILLKSVRSIQNQNFKNIEIIIVDDCSTDNSSKIFRFLLETDPRIRIFHHLKNMGLYRSRMDGILYSKGKYIIPFDAGDLYEDNYVLEDAYKVMEEYKLDSSKFLFRKIRSFKSIEKSILLFHVENSKIVYRPSDIEKYNRKIFSFWGNIWTRIVRKNIYIKGLYLLNDILLNLYKNMWEDVWYNTIVNRASFSFSIIDRIAYVYMQDGTGEGSGLKKTYKQKDKVMKEFLGFLYFDYFMNPNQNIIRSIVNQLKHYEVSNKINLSFIKSKFYVLYDLINILLQDHNISQEDKNYLKELLKKTKKRQKEIRRRIFKFKNK